MVIHLAAAAHHVAHVILAAVARAAGHGILLENVDALALHLTVAHQIAGGGEGGQAGAYQIGRFMIDALGLAGTGKGLIVTAGIIHGSKPRFLVLPFGDGRIPRREKVIQSTKKPP